MSASDVAASARESVDTTLAPFALVRLAALPYRALAELTPPRTADRVAAASAAERELEQWRLPVEDALFAAVPRAEPRIRRTLLELRRAVHGGRRPRLRTGEIEAAERELDPDARAAVRTWLEIEQRHGAELTEAARELEAEVESHVRPHLRALAGDEAFGRALALASPELFRRALRPSRAEAGASGDEESLLRYAVRAAAKTSPFSSFIALGPVPVGGPEPPRPLGVSLDAVATPSRALLCELARAALARPAFLRSVSLQTNRTLRELGDGRVEVLGDAYTVINSRFWRLQRRRVIAVHPAVASILADARAPAPGDHLARRLEQAGLSPESADGVLAKSVERGLLWPSPHTDVFDDEPGRSTLGLLEGTPAAEPLAELAAGAELLGRASAADRLAVVERCAAAARRARAALSLPEADQSRPPLIEGSPELALDGALPDGIVGLVAELAEWLGEHLELKHEYGYIRDRFVEQFGAGGTCDDVVRFAAQIADGMGQSLEMWDPTAVGAERRGPRRRGERGVGVTALLQVAAPAADAAARGDAHAVVNRVYEGVGWLAARHSLGIRPGAASLRGALREWLVDAHAPAEPVDFPICGDCSDLQVHPRLTRRVLAWPGEPLLPGRTGTFDPARLRLRHDLETNMLELREADGPLIAPVFLGSALPTPAWGSAYAVATLAHPFRLERPLFPRPRELGDAVDHRARVVSGRLILRRACWWLPARRIQERWYSVSGAQRLLRARADCERDGLPLVFFAQPASFLPSGLPAVIPELAKPLWVDVRNPFCLDALEQVVARGDWLLVEEMVPGPEELWLSLDGEARVSEFHVEFVL